MPADHGGDRSEFEERLRAGMRRLAEQARPSPGARERLHRRARREPLRRLGVVAVSYALVVAVAAGLLAGVRLYRQDQDVALPPRPGPTDQGTASTAGAPTTAVTATTAPAATPTTVAGGSTPTTPPPIGGAAPGAGFGTDPRRRERPSPPPSRIVRLDAGRHDGSGFDRVVVEFDGAVPGYDVRYVERVVADGSGEPVALLGAADLRVVIRPAEAHDDAGQSTLAATRLVPGFPAVLEARLVSDFEAVVTIGIGAPSRTPFRVTELRDPSRLVIDLWQPP